MIKRWGILYPGLTRRSYSLTAIVFCTFVCILLVSPNTLFAQETAEEEVLVPVIPVPEKDAPVSESSFIFGPEIRLDTGAGFLAGITCEYGKLEGSLLFLFSADDRQSHLCLNLLAGWFLAMTGPEDFPIRLSAQISVYYDFRSVKVQEFVPPATLLDRTDIRNALAFRPGFGFYFGRTFILGLSAAYSFGFAGMNDGRPWKMSDWGFCVSLSLGFQLDLFKEEAAQ